jgi:hypothetical protein
VGGQVTVGEWRCWLHALAEKTMESVFCVLIIVQRKQLLSELARPRWRLTDKLGWVVTTWWYWAIFGWEIEK